MPDYYIAEDGTIHDREAEHRSRTQHTAAPAVADTTAEGTPEVSFARKFVYWLFALSASVFAAVCAGSHVFFTVKSHGAVAAVTGFYLDLSYIDKHNSSSFQRRGRLCTK